VDQRLQFLSSYQKEEMSVTDLCHEGISRPTAYKWIKRYEEVGPEGLLDLTSTPHTCPTQRRPRLKTRSSRCGNDSPPGEPGTNQPEGELAAASTVGQILSRAGLYEPETAEGAYYSEFATVFAGDCTESALVHGFQRAMTARRTR
jgi:Helix-turn-helix domain